MAIICHHNSETETVAHRLILIRPETDTLDFWWEDGSVIRCPYAFANVITIIKWGDSIHSVLRI